MASDDWLAPDSDVLPDDIALFLDLDGTLVELAPDPASVQLSQRVVAVLRKLETRLDGAIAVVSGRPREQLNRMLGALKLPRVGLHGLDREEIARSGELEAWRARLEPARTTLGWALAGRPRLRLEDKGATIAVHFREAPGEEMYVQQLLDALAARLGSDFEVLDGSLVKELRSKAGDKGEAVRRFMGARPFIGRMPVYVGDDTTDLDGFRVVESLGGVTIAVGERIAGQYRLRSPAAVQTWLEALADRSSHGRRPRLKSGGFDYGDDVTPE